jgi:hypothetical protein
MAPQSSESQIDEIRQVVLEAARTELAAMSAGIKFWAGWVESADRYARALSAELTKIEDDSVPAGEAVARVSDLSRAYLRDLTELPRSSIRHFTGELDKIGQPKRRRARVARAKD